MTFRSIVVILNFWIHYYLHLQLILWVIFRLLLPKNKIFTIILLIAIVRVVVIIAISLIFLVKNTFTSLQK